VRTCPSEAPGSDDSSDSAVVSALQETVFRLQQAQQESELLDRDAARAHELQLIQAQRDLEQDRCQGLQAPDASEGQVLTQ
jgi:hypothetical protein